MKSGTNVYGLLAAAAMFFAGGCATVDFDAKEGRRVSSRFIGKKMSTFELHSGFSLSSKKLPDGGRLHFWRSDWAGYSGSSRDSGYGERCDLLNPRSYIVEIVEIRVVKDKLVCI